MPTIMVCPKCKHMDVRTNNKGISFCRYCGHKGKKEEFQQEIYEER